MERDLSVPARLLSRRTRDQGPSHLINSTNVNPLPRTISGNRSEGQASGYMEGREGRGGEGRHWRTGLVGCNARTAWPGVSGTTGQSGQPRELARTRQ